MHSTLQIEGGFCGFWARKTNPRYCMFLCLERHQKTKIPVVADVSLSRSETLACSHEHSRNAVPTPQAQGSHAYPLPISVCQPIHDVFAPRHTAPVTPQHTTPHRSPTQIHFCLQTLSVCKTIEIRKAKNVGRGTARRYLWIHVPTARHTTSDWPRSTWRGDPGRCRSRATAAALPNFWPRLHRTSRGLAPIKSRSTPRR
ncbi:hypothetical protein P171DRAFT_142959 [Karstenula rhodostoma CBS 690.94]|uniref:Uncharacterized protein n=1 Tax=Karstenula rhodostoma CBS 690.94 TaxID=1392251 RepID=A0A9P4PSN6_9PLEO|nr:hypothetical protein P171DRAFT_142959 [Karstenula rhodostoma CBS 690.94]